MTPESAAFLAKARQFLRKADDMLADEWPDEAGRAAYLAGFHAAQAYVFERIGRTTKTHSGLHRLFADATKADTRFDPVLRPFLSRAYSVKAIADYETGAAAEVTVAKAVATMQSAARFVEHVNDLLESG